MYFRPLLQERIYFWGFELGKPPSKCSDHAPPWYQTNHTV